MSNHIYSVPAPNPHRGAFNLSYEYKTSAEMGLLLPVLACEAMPGGVYSVDWTSVIRLQPLQQSILHNLMVYFDLFFCPYRELWDNPADADDNFEDFITGGEDGTLTPTFPDWNPATKTIHTLWDSFGFPLGITPTDRQPSALLPRAYTWCVNEWYYSNTIDTPETIDLTGGTDTTDYSVCKRRWPHDYFTAALETQQLGTAPSLPVTGSAVFAQTAGGGTLQPVNYRDSDTKIAAGASKTALDDNSLSATSVNIAAFRLATAQQRFLERMNLFGSRYTEYLLGHWGQRLPDSTMRRPVHIGSIKTPITISEVLQTSATGISGGSTALGEHGGHGINMDSNHVGRYRAKEWGVLIGIMSIMPEANYEQGIDRMWIKSDRYDFYSPEFANLSDQAIEEVELKASATGSENTTIFGYIGAWDQYRSRPSRVCGYFRDGQTFEHWVLSRHFGSRPALNSSFLEMDGLYASAPEMKRPWVVQNEFSFLVQCGNNIRAILPIPQHARPGGLS